MNCSFWRNSRLLKVSSPLMTFFYIPQLNFFSRERFEYMEDIKRI